MTHSDVDNLDKLLICCKFRRFHVKVCVILVFSSMIRCRREALMIVIVRSLSFVFHMFRSLIVAPLYLGNDDQADLTKCEASFNPKAPMSMPQCLYHRQLQFWLKPKKLL
ncbi:hypothetical protein KC19_4G253400 [Ceratodon purpureus]|uniref:Uncharacterized protein n=1 Tax=Ceratodon purpureus TaxID=3225 RepID=A0A8T0IF40_CERPU|nr:hypothetical protein KC19_4G253400 [Ceratodon purpureus]